MILLDPIEDYLLRGSQGGEGRIIRDGGDIEYDKICPDVVISSYQGSRVLFLHLFLQSNHQPRSHANLDPTS